MLAMILDVHQTVQKAQKTYRSADNPRQFKLILDVMGEGIYGVDSGGNTTFVNPAASRITGYKAADLMGRHQHEILHHTKLDGSPFPAEACPIYMTIRDGTVHHVADDIFWKKDGTNFPVEYVSTPIREGQQSRCRLL